MMMRGEIESEAGWDIYCKTQGSRKAKHQLHQRPISELWGSAHFTQCCLKRKTNTHIRIKKKKKKIYIPNLGVYSMSVCVGV